MLISSLRAFALLFAAPYEDQIEERKQVDVVSVVATQQA